MDDEFGGIFCMCWMIPFFATALCLSIAHQIQNSWRARKLPDNDPHCAKCGYNLRGLTAMRCSECGSALGKNTVLFRADKPPFTLGARLLIWTTFMPGPALMLYMLTIAVWPMSYQTTWDANLEYVVGSRSISVTLTAGQSGKADPKNLEHAVLTVDESGPNANKRHQFVFNKTTNQVTWGDKPEQSADVGPEAFYEALKQLDVLPTRIIEREELATLIAEMLHQCRTDPDSDSYAAANTWNRQILFYQDVTNRHLVENITLIIAILVGGFAWLWGMHWISQTWKRDMKNYTRQSELLFTRFRESVEANASTFASANEQTTSTALLNEDREDT